MVKYYAIVFIVAIILVAMDIHKMIKDEDDE